MFEALDVNQVKKVLVFPFKGFNFLKTDILSLSLMPGLWQDGVVTEDEFVEGCKKDDAFVYMLDNFDGENIWG